MADTLLPTIRAGVKSTEMWLVVLISIVTAIFPGMPKESLVAIGTWVVARSSQKAFGLGDGKRSYQSSEFWLTLIFSAAKMIFPDLPEEAFYAVLSWAGLRTAIKIKQK